jgi:hypothetical protein
MQRLATYLMFGLGALALVVAPQAFALHSPEHYSLFGDAAYVTPGNASDRAVELTSDTSTTTIPQPDGFAGIHFEVGSSTATTTGTTTTFADLTHLSSDYFLESDDACVGGSPRFQIKVRDTATTSTSTQNIFVYFNNCVSGTWANTGNLLASTTGSGTTTATTTVDTSQLGGTFFDPLSNALTNYGDYEVVSVQLVVDAGWAASDGEQTVLIDNTMINDTLFTYEEDTEEPPTATVPTTKEQCMNGGWMNSIDTASTTFKNQGDCVSFVATGGKNMGAGTGTTTATSSAQASSNQNGNGNGNGGNSGNSRALRQ